MQGDDTIHALASGSGTSAIAVVRVSGPRAEAVLESLAGRPVPDPRRAVLRTLHDAAGAPIDRALVVRFAEGASFTGEASVEFQCHGGRSVVRAVLAAIAAAGPSRLADPGEFTWRAFRNGCMDLTEVEALGDLLEAETELQRRHALRGMEGALRHKAEGWREALVSALALAEVTIDWADEEVPENVWPEVDALLERVAREIAEELALAAGARRVRHGLEVALLGAPNSGKSSLLNALAGREAAITSPLPGTTRDVVEVRYDLDGLPVVFLDTAGLQETAEPIERIGIARARDRAAAADLRLFLGAPDAGLTPSVLALERPGDIRVASKADLGSGPGVAVSALSGAGLVDLLAAVGSVLTRRVGGEGLVAHERQHAALSSGLSALGEAREGLGGRGAEEVAEDIRTAMRALERLTGRIDVEDMLGAVFGRFCLGK